MSKILIFLFALKKYLFGSPNNIRLQFTDTSSFDENPNHYENHA